MQHRPTAHRLLISPHPTQPNPTAPHPNQQVLMIQGFLALRKHADRIVLLAEMMAGAGLPCFKSRATAIAGLRKRFHLNLPEPQVGLDVARDWWEGGR